MSSALTALSVDKFIVTKYRDSDRDRDFTYMDFYYYHGNMDLYIRTLYMVIC